MDEIGVGAGVVGAGMGVEATAGAAVEETVVPNGWVVKSRFSTAAAAVLAVVVGAATVDVTGTIGAAAGVVNVGRSDMGLLGVVSDGVVLTVDSGMGCCGGVLCSAVLKVLKILFKSIGCGAEDGTLGSPNPIIVLYQFGVVGEAIAVLTVSAPYGMVWLLSKVPLGPDCT